jgi:hypothetical protein
MKPNLEHLVFTGKNPIRPAMECLHCGTRSTLTLPISCHQFSLLTKDFIKRHRRCPPKAP